MLRGSSLFVETAPLSLPRFTTVTTVGGSGLQNREYLINFAR